MKYKEGDRVFIITNNMNVRPCVIARRDYDMYIVGFGDGGAIRLRESRLFPSAQDAERRLGIKVEEPPHPVHEVQSVNKNTEKTPWDWM